MTVAASYFAEPRPSFWKWQEAGNVVTWSDDETITFRQELAIVYRRLRTQSLPPFGAVVLLLAACRDAWNSSMHRIGFIDRLLEADRHSDRLNLLMEVCEGLARIRWLDASLRTSPDAKAELVAMVFEGQGEQVPPAVFESLLGDLVHGLPEQTLHATSRVDGIDHVLRALACLRQGLGRVDPEALALRVKTGLEQPVRALPAVTVPLAGSARQLVADLQDDPELGGVARLARLLLAAVHVPTPMSLPEELPVGGVSDISNRGTLDRLLLSELASDGLMLAVRVAMNEALYLRREAPPSPPPRKRLVLLDSGLRMWGIPRVFATAVGLACAAGATKTTDVRVYRARGKSLDDVDFTTATGIADHLAELDHRIHPGAALVPLADASAATGGAVDVIVVTGVDVASDPAFQRALADATFSELHLATVSRDGEFELWLRNGRGRRLLRKATFALDDVLFPPRKPTLPLLDPGDAELPAIFRADRFPIRMACSVDAERSWHVQGLGTLTYCRDGRLLHWRDAGRGALQLAEGLPEGNLHAGITRLGTGAGLAIIGKLSRRGLRLVTFDRDHSTCRHVPLEITIDQPTHAFLHHDVAFVGDASTLQACHVPTGELLATCSLAGMRHIRSRFYTVPSGKPGHPRWSWKAATFNGSEIEWVEFYQETAADGRVATAFESDDREGPLVLTTSGQLIHCGMHERRIRPPGVPADALTGIHGVSRNGTRLLLSPKASPRKRVFDLTTETIKAEPLEAEVAAIPQVTLRHRFIGIGADELDRLVLVGRRDSLWIVSAGTALGLPSAPCPTPLRLRRSFEPLPRNAGRRYELSVARFEDGSRAVLDSRGLLHLRSSAATLPELTIVLVQGQGAGWMSNGRTWGNTFFHDGPAENIEPHPVEVIHEFLKRLR
jgi:hypothetical protein